MPRRTSLSLRKETTVHSPGPRARSTERSLRRVTLEHEESARTRSSGSVSPPLLIPNSIDNSYVNGYPHNGAPESTAAAVLLAQDVDYDAQRGNLRRTHTRAMSDPLDGGSDNEDTLMPGVRSGGLPVLPRFPCAETQDRNCWSEPGVDIFHVRGAGYLKDHKKVSSGPFLMRARGCDLLLIDEKSKATTNLTRNIGGNPCVFGGHLRAAPTFIINFRLPWGILVHYYQIPEKLTPYLSPAPPTLDNLTPAERTLAKFFMGDDEYRNERLKLVPYVASGPWIVRNMVTGKPAIIGKKLPVSYTHAEASERGCCYLEADLDIGSSSKTAKRIVSMCRRYLNALTVDVGFVIQGNSEEELPEQMLGSIRIHRLDAMRAPTLISCELHQKECAPSRNDSKVRSV